MIGLDLSAASDTVNHGTLFERLTSEFGDTESPLAWLQSYLESRTPFVELDLQDQSLNSRTAFLRGLCSGLRCLPSTAAR